MSSADVASTTRLYRNIALIECANAPTLEEVLAGVAGRYLVRRLSETVVVVDHAHAEDLLKGLRKAGYTPRVISEGRL